VQTSTESAVAIAASYAAKAFGIKTGTLVREARRLCPDVIPVQANHRLYAEYHERILKAVDTCLPVEKVCSIDEMACRLMDTERQVPVARELALKVKRAASPARSASRRMSFSARSVPICRSRTAWSLSPTTSCPTSCSGSNCIGHQHVLEPELRTNKGAHDFAQHLLTKAADAAAARRLLQPPVRRASVLARRSRRLERCPSVRRAKVDARDAVNPEQRSPMANTAPLGALTTTISRLVYPPAVAVSAANLQRNQPVSCCRGEGL
jgi:hypothetical protein